MNSVSINAPKTQFNICFAFFEGQKLLAVRHETVKRSRNTGGGVRQARFKTERPATMPSAQEKKGELKKRGTGNDHRTAIGKTWSSNVVIIIVPRGSGDLWRQLMHGQQLGQRPKRGLQALPPFQKSQNNPSLFR